MGRYTKEPFITSTDISYAFIEWWTFTLNSYRMKELIVKSDLMGALWDWYEESHFILFFKLYYFDQVVFLNFINDCFQNYFLWSEVKG